MGFGELQPEREHPEMRPPLTSASTPRSTRADEELPPSARGGQPHTGSDAAGGQKTSRIGLWALLAAVAAAGILGFALLQGNGNDETQSPNWQHVAAASRRSAAGEPVVKFIGRNGSVAFLSTLGLTLADRDLSTTVAVKAALQAGDLQKANRILRDAQQLPAAVKKSKSQTPTPVAPQTTPTPQPQPQPDAQPQTIAADVPPEPEPQISDGLRQEILRGDAEFFHIYLYDSCAEDGDVVDVLLNGQPFCRVPITHAGATLSVPMSGSPVAVAIRGVHDGGGGITVACRTSQGDSFTRAMQPGEVQLLGVVRQ